MTRPRHLIVLPFLLLLIDSGCGKNAGPAGMSGEAPPAGQTGGLAPSGAAYTTFGSDEELEPLKAQIPVTPENQAFASQVDRAEFDTSSTTPQVKVYASENDTQPMVFSGSLTQDQTSYKGEFTDPTGAHPDLKVAANCADPTCSTGDLILQDAQGHQAGTHITSLDGTMDFVTPTDETPEQINNSGLAVYAKKPRKVRIKTSTTLQGKTVLSITDTETNKVIYAPVTETDTDTVPTNDPTLQLYGKSSDEIILKATDSKKDPKTSQDKSVVGWLHITPVVQAPTSPAVVPEQCPIQISENVSPLVTSLLKDCTRPQILKNIALWRGKRRKTFVDFMKISDKSKEPSATGTPLEFKHMVDILRSKNLPDVWGVVTLKESGFHIPTRPGKRGERGVWQILPATAKELKLPAGWSDNVTLETVAAANYYNGFLSRWKNDPEMALAAYNRGEGGVKTSMIKGNPLAAAHNYPTDLWSMCKFTLDKPLKTGTCLYVPEIVAAMLVSLDPRDYGVTEVGALEGK